MAKNWNKHLILAAGIVRPVIIRCKFALIEPYGFHSHYATAHRIALDPALCHDAGMETSAATECFIKNGKKKNWGIIQGSE